MDSVEYRYEDSGVGFDEDNPPPMVVSLNDVTLKSIEDICHFLCESIELRFDLTGIDTHLESRPIVFEISENLRISEYTFWSLVYDSQNGNFELGKKYLNTVINWQKGGELPHCKAQEVVGQHPVYAYIERFVLCSDIAENIKTSQLQSISSFIDYLAVCDLDHEVWHHEYIERVLDFLQNLDRKNFTRLMLLYLDSQFGEYVLNFSRVSESGFLKVAVDHIVARDSGWLLKVRCLRLCANVYGMDHEPVLDILQYCRMRKDVGDENDLKNFSKELDVARRNGEVGRRNVGSTRILDTGFHTYKDGRWVRNENVSFSGSS
ncbi:hypothetical protein QSV34_07320 [Porticoccus sp. W117]|uniref:hypothetical protein n=1 Tax=Porticoccus sp. W117 TaxID=3054777 RepID=UPI002599E232|nr:hypothetical protein [Porticoccus sp. W117]MDM3871166.1 hypothetical protein [Porticoccus sp. W117]